ncbi:MAG: zinc-ribbon domain-containing protein [Rhodomicrobium sp.]
MIIECPACTTRYDIKAELPPDGRTVRCAKCGTVWRAMPESEEAPQAEDVAWAVSEARESIEGHEAEEPDENHFAGALGHGRENEWTSGEASAGEHLEESHSYVEGGGIVEEAPQEQHEESVAAENSGKVSWFSSFRRKRKSKEKEEAQEIPAAAMHEQTSAETIPFPRTSFPVESQGSPEEEFRTLEEARQTVRSVFSSLGDGRPSPHYAARAVPAPAGALEAEEARDEAAPAAAETEPDPDPIWSGGAHSREAGSAGFWASGAGDAKSWDPAVIGQAETDGWQGLNGKSEPPSAAASEAVALAETKQKRGGREPGQDADAALRDAMRAHFPFAANEPTPSPSPNKDLAERLETHLRSAAASPFEEAPQPRRAAGLWAKPPPAIDEDMNEASMIAEETFEARDDDAVFDQRLYREIEETQEKSGAVHRGAGRGSLALVAAWGLFICVAGGLVSGFFVFRDIVADAVPGLAPLYRSLGTPVTVQPLIFEGVQYDWKVAENKPVLIVSGSVYNRAQRKVRVPQFYITIKDQDPALDREISANLKVTRSKIRSNERADFDIELVSPSPTITSVELELRNVR